MLGTLVVGALLVLFDELQVGLVDAVDVADGMCADRAERILAEQARLDFDAGKTVAVGGETRHLIVG